MVIRARSEYDFLYMYGENFNNGFESLRSKTSNDWTFIPFDLNNRFDNWSYKYNGEEEENISFLTCKVKRTFLVLIVLVETMWLYRDSKHFLSGN